MTCRLVGATNRAAALHQETFVGDVGHLELGGAGRTPDDGGQQAGQEPRAGTTPRHETRLYPAGGSPGGDDGLVPAGHGAWPTKRLRPRGHEQTADR